MGKGAPIPCGVSKGHLFEEGEELTTPTSEETIKILVGFEGVKCIASLESAKMEARGVVAGPLYRASRNLGETPGPGEACIA